MIPSNIYQAPQSDMPLPRNKRGPFVVFARVLTILYSAIWLAVIFRLFVDIGKSSENNSDVPYLIGSLIGFALLFAITLYPFIAFWRVSGKTKLVSHVAALWINAVAGVMLFALFAVMASFASPDRALILWMCAVIMVIPYAANVVAILRLK